VMHQAALLDGSSLDALALHLSGPSVKARANSKLDKRSGQGQPDTQLASAPISLEPFGG